MLVEFEHDWFAPSGKLAGKVGLSSSGALYRAAHGEQEVPDEYRDVLPSTAKVVEGDPRDKPAPKKKLTPAQKAALTKKANAKAKAEAEKAAKEKEDLDAHTLNVDPGEV